MLKIETRRGFENLPDMLLAAMRAPKCGVMIARGDLAVECGFERLAEVQEEILWVCEAAHVPVIWATQVLETLSQDGMPSRAEITDAAMAHRAECVMLNKGPHVVSAVRVLDDILRRMQAHQSEEARDAARVALGTPLPMNGPLQCATLRECINLRSPVQTPNELAGGPRQPIEALRTTDVVGRSATPCTRTTECSPAKYKSVPTPPGVAWTMARRLQLMATRRDR